jgi:hypothetical protein
MGISESMVLLIALTILESVPLITNDISLLVSEISDIELDIFV